MTPEMVHALATATRQWHQATRHFELCSRSFSDAQTQLQHAERDLHELARAIEVVAGQPAGELAGELVSNAGTPIGVVTMPIVAPPAGAANATADGIDAAQIVLEQMMQGRMGMP
jgi:hypothetical protein